MLCCVWQLEPQHPPTVPCVETDADGHAQPPVLWLAVLQSAKPDLQVYVQLPPLQPTPVSFDRLHALPQAPQSLVFVCVLTH